MKAVIVSLVLVLLVTFLVPTAYATNTCKLSGVHAIGDIDGNGSVGALTDGYLILLNLLGFKVSERKEYIDLKANRDRIDDYLKKIRDFGFLDVDGNGKNEAFNDGYIIFYGLFGFSTKALQYKNPNSPLSNQDILIRLDQLGSSSLHCY